MVIFNSYVSLPEGIHGPRFHRTKHRPNQFEREGHVESHWYRFLFLSQDESYWIGRPRGILIGRQHIHEKVAIRLSGSICSMGVRTASCESMWKHHKYLIVSLCFCKESNVKADLFNLFQIIFHNHWLTNICIYIIYIYIYIQWSKGSRWFWWFKRVSFSVFFPFGKLIPRSGGQESQFCRSNSRGRSSDWMTLKICEPEDVWPKMMHTDA